jgi:uncharacterized small protein (DUF1192 family)
MIDPNDAQHPPASQSPIVIGEDLYGISVAELQERMSILKAEIQRCEAEMGKKQSEMTAAHDIFKKKDV